MISFGALCMLMALSSCGTARHPEPTPNIEWASMGFSLNNVETDAMWLQSVAVDPDTGEAREGDAFDSVPARHLCAVQPLLLPLAATALNYGQVIFEGLKAFRQKDGSIAIFRPEVNAIRMQKGAKRFFLPQVPTTTFIRAVDAVVGANAAWVPPYQKGSLYLRPLLMGTGAALGMNPSTEATFCIYSSPVGSYFKTSLSPIQLLIVPDFCRAAPGGAGSVKTSGNYAPSFAARRQAKTLGYDEILCMDARTGESIEEAGGSNFFAVFPNNTLFTPSLSSGTILDGVTRDSILHLAEKEFGHEVFEGRLTLDDLAQASEAFCCGTGACITPVGSVAVLDKDGSRSMTRQIVFGCGEPGPLTRKLYSMLTAIQTGSHTELSEKYKQWMHVVDPT